MRQDFIFANGSFANTPGSGLQIILSRLEPDSNYAITLWGFDRYSCVQSDRLNRASDLSLGGGETTRPSFDATVVPETLLDYRIVVTATSDNSGELILDGVVSATDPADPDSFLDPVGDALAKFDFNQSGSATLEGWTAADLGNGSDVPVLITTEAIGAVKVDIRERGDTNTDTGDVGRNDLWRDFVFANGSANTAPDTGLKITLTGLAPHTTYPITIWVFDDGSNDNRSADWAPRAQGKPL